MANGKSQAPRLTLQQTMVSPDNPFLLLFQCLHLPHVTGDLDASKETELHGYAALDRQPWPLSPEWQARARTKDCKALDEIIIRAAPLMLCKGRVLPKCHQGKYEAGPGSYVDCGLLADLLAAECDRRTE